LDVDELWLVLVLKYQDVMACIMARELMGSGKLIFINRYKEVLLIDARVEWGLAAWFFLAAEGAQAGEDLFQCVTKESGFEMSLVVSMLYLILGI
jgi:hypothetical protein